MPRRPKTTKSATVRKIIKPPDQPERAEIEIHDADELYREVRIENSLETAKGKKVKLKKGADVEVTFAADSAATEPKKETESPDEPAN